MQGGSPTSQTASVLGTQGARRSGLLGWASGEARHTHTGLLEPPPPLGCVWLGVPFSCAVVVLAGCYPRRCCPLSLSFRLPLLLPAQRVCAPQVLSWLLRVMVCVLRMSWCGVRFARGLWLCSILCILFYTLYVLLHVVCVCAGAPLSTPHRTRAVSCTVRVVCVCTGVSGCTPTRTAWLSAPPQTALAMLSGG